MGKGKYSLVGLLREINGVGQKMLIEQLKELQEFGMVDKLQHEGYPLRVKYFLTPKGEKLLGIVVAMQEIGIELMKENDK